MDSVRSSDAVGSVGAGGYLFVHDAGHGWLRVPVSVIEMLELGCEISSCSYLDCEVGWLEEDCDLPRFMARHVGVLGRLPVVSEERHDGLDSVVRLLPSWSVGVNV